MLPINEHCPCGKAHRFTTKVVVEKGAIQKLPAILQEKGLQRAFLIADANTYRAAGETVSAVLEGAGTQIKKYIFTKDTLEPDEANVGLAIMHFDPTADVVIGVGSGVINDISKIVANVSGKPYIIVGTAPSMDGYASATSSMTVEGLKVSLNSKCADVIIGDLDILCAAPLPMMLSGLGDMLAKYISICEWRISNLINGEYYCEEIAALVRTSLKKCVDNAQGLLSGEETGVMAVFEGLTLCGAAMQMAGVSRPASGVEHYISHVWDMRGAAFGTPVDTHGIQCAVGTLLAAKLYEKLKTVTPDREKAIAYAQRFDFAAWSEELRAFLGKGAESMIALEEKEQKYNVVKHATRIDTIIENWDAILEIVNQEIPALAELEALFDRVGLPKTAAEIGIDETILPMTFLAAKDIRDKYVLPRLCWDLGLLEEFANALTKGDHHG